MILTAADLSSTQASTARAKEPIPAARMAAESEPFVRAGALGEAAPFGMFIFLLPGAVESCGRPVPERTCLSSRRRNPQFPQRQTKPRQSRASRRGAADGS